MTKTMPWASGDAARPLSSTLAHVLAAALLAAGRLLTVLAARITASQAAAAVQTVEFHAVYGEAGAPEGALYVNGMLVGTIEGVTRL